MPTLGVLYEMMTGYLTPVTARAVWAQNLGGTTKRGVRRVGMKSEVWRVGKLK